MVEEASKYSWLSFLVLVYFTGASFLFWIIASEPGRERIGLGGMILLIIQALIWACLRDRLCPE